MNAMKTNLLKTTLALFFFTLFLQAAPGSAAAFTSCADGETRGGTVGDCKKFCENHGGTFIRKNGVPGCRTQAAAPPAGAAASFGGRQVQASQLHQKPQRPGSVGLAVPRTTRLEATLLPSYQQLSRSRNKQPVSGYFLPNRQGPGGVIVIYNKKGDVIVCIGKAASCKEVTSDSDSATTSTR